MEAVDFLIQILHSTTRVSVPLVLAGMAGVFSERGGVVDIGMEGKMLMAAFTAACVAHLTGSAWAGVGAAILASAAMGLLHGFACITHRGNQVVSGMAINILASGLTVTLGNAWFETGGQTPTLPAAARFVAVNLPGAEAVAGIPVLGELYSRLLNSHNVLVYLSYALVPLGWWVLFRTRFGLRLRAVGENPAAVDTAGISVSRLRYSGVLIAGSLCGLAGAYIATAQSAGFIREMTAGKGYIALAAMIFGKWRPFPTLMACLLFGALDALAIRLQGVPIPGIGEIPVQFIQALPYVLTVILLAGFIGQSIAPKADGIPYVKER
jgi:general nucleoside transport system permease protein